ncbi:MAG: short-chain dehydrogenase, partial [Nitrososphaerales archaeon]
RVMISSSNSDKINKAREALSHSGEVFAVTADLAAKQDIDVLVSKSVELLGGLDTLIYVTGSPHRVR